jgi:hypothetical protein
MKQNNHLLPIIGFISGDQPAPYSLEKNALSKLLFKNFRTADKFLLLLHSLVGYDECLRP